METAILALALVANSYEPVRSALPRTEISIVASVTILAAGEIDFDLHDQRAPKGVARQHRIRDGMPLVEFY